MTCRFTGYRSLRIIPRALIITYLTALPGVAWADAASDAAVLHARALIAEDDGNSAQALALLRDAAAQEPTSEIIAYDRARLALENSGAADPNDLTPLTEMTLRFEASRRLKVYALAAMGQIAEAERAISATRIGDDEAKELREVFASVLPSKFTVTTSLGAEQDNNVTLLPDAEPDHSPAARAVLDATLAYRPTKVLELAFIGQLGYHLDNRNSVALYDYGIMSALLIASHNAGPLSLETELSGTVVTASFLAETFSTDATARFDVQLRNVFLHPGLYGRLGLRNFIAGNLEDEIFDRDTVFYGTGLVSDWQTGHWSYLARAGVLLEPADGAQQRQRGFEGNGIVRFRLRPLTFAATVNTTRRIYYDATTNR
ncbi:MAG: hypothetical protein H7Z43_08345, partial [Clostridia bacterium]|nr:hypothetical protein [Deltaproteobacteria bacterium]